jgi:hypothetical protein
MAPPSLVDELVQLAQDEDTPLSELLRRTRVFAAKLKIPELEEWVKQETSGYDRENSEVPAYRRIPCELKAANLGRNWIPVIFRVDPVLAQHFRMVSLHQSVAELESLLASDHSTVLSANVSPGEYALLMELNPQLGNTQVRRFIGRASLKGVLEAVRNRVLDAALELGSKGVRGEGLSFSDEERAKAAGMGTSIVNHIYGDNANVAATAHSPNSGVAFASGSATINQHIGNIQQGNPEVANAFKSMFEALKTDASLDAAKRAEAEQQLTFLAEQAAKPEQKRQPLAVLRSVWAGIGQAAALSANLTKTLEVCGPVIVGYLGG